MILKLNFNIFVIDNNNKKMDFGKQFKINFVHNEILNSKDISIHDDFLDNDYYKFDSNQIDLLSTNLENIFNEMSYVFKQKFKKDYEDYNIIIQSSLEIIPSILKNEEKYKTYIDNFFDCKFAIGHLYNYKTNQYLKDELFDLLNNKLLNNGLKIKDFEELIKLKLSNPNIEYV